jgi:putative acetyltransferase
MGEARGPIVIKQASEPKEIELAASLFREYQAAIEVDLCFQGFAEELAGLPGSYAPPRGALLIAHVGNEVAGCVALRPLDEGSAEMKRLYVRDAFRGTGLGRRLAEAVIAAARAAGYSRMRLDTLDAMTEAISLYRALGFTEIDAYRPNPLPGPRYFELRLS